MRAARLDAQRSRAYSGVSRTRLRGSGGETRAYFADDSQGSGLDADPRRRSDRSARWASEKHDARRLMAILRRVQPNKGLHATALRAAREAQGVVHISD